MSRHVQNLNDDHLKYSNNLQHAWACPEYNFRKVYKSEHVKCFQRHFQACLGVPIIKCLDKLGHVLKFIFVLNIDGNRMSKHVQACLFYVE